jgi:multisubunit Na+/H+ antiporter MnhE subunit
LRASTDIRRLASRAPAFAGQVALFLALWLALVGAVSAHEALVGLAVAVVAAVGSTIAWPRRPVAADARSIAQLWRFPKVAAVGTWEILAVLARQLVRRIPAESLLLTVPFDGGEGDRGETRAALAVAYTSATPNFVVLGIDRERKLLVYHQVRRSPVPEMTRRLGAKA